MAHIFDAVAAIRQGSLSKQHVYQENEVPISIKIEQREMVPVILIERSNVLLSSVKGKKSDSSVKSH